MPNARRRTAPNSLSRMVIGILRAPVLIGLQPGNEEVDVGLERRLEGLVPVHEVSEDRQRLRVERVEPGPNTSPTLPSFTNTAICESRTVSLPPF